MASCGDDEVDVYGAKSTVTITLGEAVDPGDYKIESSLTNKTFVYPLRVYAAAVVHYEDGRSYLDIIPDGIVNGVLPMFITLNQPIIPFSIGSYNIKSMNFTINGTRYGRAFNINTIMMIDEIVFGDTTYSDSVYTRRMINELKGTFHVSLQNIAVNYITIDASGTIHVSQ